MCWESEAKELDEKRAELERKKRLDETLREIIIVEGFKKDAILSSKN